MSRKHMSIVITGGAGFIGSCLLKKLNIAGITDIVIVDELGSTEKWKNLLGKQYEDYVDKDFFLDALSKGTFDKTIDCIIHLGACSSTTETNAAYLMDNNFNYSKKLAEWTIRNKKRFLYASSAATYGAGEKGYSDRDTVAPTLMPLNMYGYSKHAFDLWVLKNNLQKIFVGFKFFNIFGPNEYHKEDMRSMIHKGYQHIKQKGTIRLFKSYRKEYGDGEQKRDFMYVQDAVDVVGYFFNNPQKTGIYNVGTGKAHSWNELACAIFKALDLNPSIEYFDMPHTLREKYQYFTEADITKLRQAGFSSSFLKLEDAVKEYVALLETTQYI
ncbi:MAG: ADP-glyceromanno-heptose 6-epimerase [Candidatus Omnitrophica bacterium]|nr:ADP-glyceromanno-heptose 6-epimerase [Candidatus Omnitrophota bacterium]